MPTKFDRPQRRSKIESASSCAVSFFPEKLEALIEGITAKEIAEMMERCYRRGYTQGAWAAIEAAKNGHDAEEINKWFVKLLVNWRYKKHKESQEFPPEINQLKGTKPRKVRPLVGKPR